MKLFLRRLFGFAILGAQKVNPFPLPKATDTRGFASHYTGHSTKLNTTGGLHPP